LQGVAAVAVGPFIEAPPLANVAARRSGVELDDDRLQRVGNRLPEALEIEVLPDRRPAAGRLRGELKKRLAGSTAMPLSSTSPAGTSATGTTW